MTPVPNLVAIPVPEAVTRPAPPVCVCDVDPEVFRVFAFVVLAFHRELRMADGRPWCSCGQRWSACAYARLADDILFAAAPGRDAAGAGAWR
jgi:hypothetical protein